MAIYTATIHWQRGDQAFTDGRYSRAHAWEFDGGTVVPASSSPHVVPLPLSVEAAVDPEEAFIAAVASCHMLFFLDFARRAGLVVEDYRDAAEGILGRNATGQPAMTLIRLRPAVRYQGTPPDAATEDALHHKAHAACFIANSVSTRIETEPVR